MYSKPLMLSLQEFSKLALLESYSDKLIQKNWIMANSLKKGTLFHGQEAHRYIGHISVCSHETLLACQKSFPKIECTYYFFKDTFDYFCKISL